MKIPYEQLSEEVVTSLIESFVLREGTDYGDHEISLPTKVEQIRAQLEKGDLQIVFDAESESVSILTKRDADKLSAEDSPSSPGRS